MTRRIGIAGLIWGSSILLSRLIGIVREHVLGRTLGVSPDADTYRAAFVVPDMLFYLLAGGALSIVLIPILAAHIERGEDARAWRSVVVIGNFLGIVLLALAPVVWVAMPALAHAVAPGFSSTQTAMLVRLSRIMLPAVAFHMLGGLMQAALLARDKHAIPALAPLVYSAGVIAGGLLGRSAEGFAWGVLAGATLGPFALPAVACLRAGLRWQPVVTLREPDLRTWLLRSLPVMLGWSIVAMDDAVLAHFASALGAGKLALLGYAKQLMKVPMGVFGSAMGFAAYPVLARMCAAGRDQEAWNTLARATKQVLALAFCSQVVLTAAGPELGALVYTTRRISADSIVELGDYVAVFSMALGAWSAHALVARGLYARGKVWLPTALGTGVLLATLPLYYLGVEHFGAMGLAAASSAGITLYAVLLGILARRELHGDTGLTRFLVRALPATAAGIALALGLRHALGPSDLDWPSTAWRALLLGTLGAAGFVAAALVLGLEGMHDALRAAMRPLRRP